MANVASALKAEIARVARKEIRAETGQLKTAAANHRRQIAGMRKKIDNLERELRRLSRSDDRTSVGKDDSEGPQKQLRFSPARFAAQRKRLGLSAREMGSLIGVSPLSIYKWEKGDARPRAKQLQAISQVRKIGKRDAIARLESLGAMA